ncbi:GGDEF domain-containing protein [Pseudofrankia sp. BMG5.36]|uniref:GGDEF domain-containing protein n=1 Tax=Pseudofrankia sp. BMG5.36 TaxID=1834512 RepID=UPI0008D952CD|nr:GGDEF domain-containing protein [Pseudofrankia sp. BMG5.36]OHV51321.1 diguanylate cyclase [Pseudofrankia sp. BMG5.36]
MSGLRGVVDAADRLWRPASLGRAPWLLRYALIASVALLGLDVALAALLELHPARAATTLVNATIQLAAAIACFWSARRVHGAERRWRVLIAITSTGAMLASLSVTPALLAGHMPHQGGISAGYAAFLIFYVLALAGLLCVPTDRVGEHGGGPGRRRHSAYRWYTITLLDCLLIVGSIILLQWGMTLASLVQAGHHTETFELAMIHQVAGLVLATAVVLIATFRRPRAPAVLALLGTGLLAYAVTTNLMPYIAAVHGLELPPWGMIGFALAYLLIFIAALAPVPRPTHPDDPAPPGPRAMWAHAVLPYAALVAAGLLVVDKRVAGVRLDLFETYGMIALVVVALIRQMVTVAENTRLLTETREQQQQLRHQAFHDPLTGLANRALFTRRLQRVLACVPDGDVSRITADYAPDTRVSLLFLDLDGFKRVNDTFGHAAGDELLKIIADRLLTETRAVDTAARLGGDEFAVILDGGGPDDPRHVGERLALAIQAPCLLVGQRYTPSASLGMVTLDSAATRPATPDILLHQADLAMYTAKRERAGRLVVYHPALAASTG